MTETPLPAFDLLPISYRSDPIDDWGTIRAAPGADGVAWALARIRDPRVPDAELWKFREAGTDPYEAVGKMFVRAVNNHHDLVEALRAIKHSIGQARKPGNDWKRELALIENLADAILTKAEAGHG